MIQGRVCHVVSCPGGPGRAPTSTPSRVRPPTPARMPGRTPRLGARALLGGTHMDHRVPTAPPTGPGATSTSTRSGAGSSNWFQNHLRQHARARVRATGSRTTCDNTRAFVQLAPGPPRPQHAPARVRATGSRTTFDNTRAFVQLVPEPPATTRSRSCNWFQNHLDELAPGTTSTSWPRTAEADAPRSKNCLISCASLQTRAPSCAPPRSPGLERRRRWSQRTRARAQAACRRHPSQTSRLGHDCLGGEPRARSARSGPAVAARRGAASPDEEQLRRGAAPRDEEQLRRAAAATPVVANYASIKRAIELLSDRRATVRAAHGSGVTGR